MYLTYPGTPGGKVAISLSGVHTGILVGFVLLELLFDV